MDMFIVDDDNLQRWGQLIKTLATGIDHFVALNNLQLSPAGDSVIGPRIGANDPRTALVAALAKIAANAPMTATDFNVLLIQTNVTVVLPPQCTTVEFCQTSGTNIVVRLPAKDFLLQREAKIKQGETYQPRQFLINWFATRQTAPAATVEERMQLNDNFVGDYSIAHCQ